MKIRLRSIIICLMVTAFADVPRLSAQDSTAAVDSTAADSTAPADTSAAAAADSTSQVSDSTAAEIIADTLAAPAETAAAADTTAKPKKKPRPPGDRVVAWIIPWDWDEYTNVIEVGLRRDDGREYSLTRNEMYQQIFDNLNLKILAIGKVARDSDGFYNMAVEYIEPADSTQTLATGKAGRSP